MKKYLALLLLFFLGKYLFAQNTETLVPLHVKNDSLAYNFQYINPGKDIPDAKLPDIKTENYTLSRYLDLKSLHLRIPVFLGNLKDRSKVIVFDTNLNSDFNDEQPVYFTDTIHSVEQGNFKLMQLLLKNGSQLSFDYSIVQPSALHLTLLDHTEEQFYLSIRPHDYRTGFIKGDSSSTEFALMTKNLYSFDKSFIVVVNQHDKQELNKNLKFGERYTVGSKIILNKDSYVFKEVSTDGLSIKLEAVDIKTTSSNTVGFKAIPFHAVTLQGIPIDLADNKGQYVLLDFWGTWCVPCKTVIPGLRELHTRYPKIKMISVAFDTNAEQVLKDVVAEKMEWDHILDPSTFQYMGRSICELYNVHVFPTYILIDTNNKIIFRDQGIDGFGRMQVFMRSLD